MIPFNGANPKSTTITITADRIHAIQAIIFHGAILQWLKFI
ncbi:hypothetical protein [Clostridium estertheticum]|nr:hypothetical protein [Clostridium estertheticum]